MRPLTVVLLVLTTLATGCATQQDVATLDRRLASVERRNAVLEKQSREIADTRQSLESKESEIKSQAASLRVSIENLEEELRVLSGRLEEVEYKTAQKLGEAESDIQQRGQKTAGLEGKLLSLEDRVRQLEAYLNLDAAAGAKPAASPAPAGAAAAPPAGEKERYAAARAAFEQGDFAKARGLFEGLLADFPDSPQANSAQFWVGETYYREKWFEKAILEYQKVVENYPKGNKLPAALLKQGFAFSNLGDNANARLILESLIQKYPDSSEAGIAAKKLQGMK
ncbi:MAG: tol-pal system protein YbgF [Desulfobacteraceae bacterium]|jgi:tol-pal system protein YbgF